MKVKSLLPWLAGCLLAVQPIAAGTSQGMSGADPEPNKIYYTSSDGSLITYNTSASFGATVTSHTYTDGQGVITFNGNVTSIGDNAFLSCSKLTSITIPDKVTSIGQYAFSGCTQLTSINLPEGLTDIGQFAFNDCAALNTALTIPEGVTSINNNTFNGCAALPAITMPEGVTSIGHYAFHGCTALTALTIPGEVTYIGNSAFRNCTALTALNIPKKVGEIGVYVFRGCSALTTLTVDSENNTFDSRGNCNAIIKTATNTLQYGCNHSTIPAGVTALGNNAFNDCAGLTSLTLPASVTSIGTGVFVGCTGLISLSVESGNTTFDSRGDCNAIIKTATNTLLFGCNQSTIPAGVTGIGNSAFIGCTGLTTLTLPQGLTTIESSAFAGCTGLTTLTIPESVTTIQSSAFKECTGLTTLTIPEGVVGIDASLFQSCTALTSVTIPKSVTFIRKEAFSDCTALTELHVGMATPPTGTKMGTTVFANVDKAHCTLYVPEEAVATYQTADQWTGFGNYVGVPNPNKYIYYTLEDGDIVTPTSTTVFGASIVTNTYSDGQGVIKFAGEVQSIGDDAFLGCSQLTSLTLPASVTSIGDYAFLNCTGLTTLTLPKGVTSIGEGAFSQCTGLTTLTIPKSVTSIGEGAFNDCHALNALSVDANNTVYDSRGNCNAIIVTANDSLMQGCKNTLIPASVTSIGDYAFAGCTGLTTLTIPKGVTSIGEGAFWFCYGLTALSVESGSTTFDSRGNCNAIIETATNTLVAGCKNTLIPASVTSIGKDAFYGCYGLTTLTLPKGVTSIGENAFVNCTGLTTLTLPKGVTSIGEEAFIGCYGLTTLTLPASVTSIGNQAFASCIGLTKIYARMATPPTIGANVFLNVDKANCTLYVFEESVANYAGADVWRDFKIEGIPNPNRYIYYTTSDGNPVTPNDTDVFGAGIDDNTYSDGQGVITFDGEVTSIGNYAFKGCTTFTSLTIPASVTSIGFDAFTGCTGLTTLTIPEGVTSIGLQAFGNCTGLTAISVESGNTTFDSRGNCNAIIHTATNNLVAGCKNTLIPEGVTSIGEGAFSSCTGLATLTIPASVTSIGNFAFSSCTGLATLTLPEGMTSIGPGTFQNCTGLTEISIPESVTSIDQYAFQNCTALTAIYAAMTTPPAIDANVFNNVTKSTCTLYVFEESVADYEATDVWTDFNIVGIPNPKRYIYYTTSDGNIVTLLDTSVFGAGFNSNTYSDGQGVIKFDGEVTSIGDYAFFNCSTLTSLTIPEGVTSIGDYAFQSCYDLTTLTIPKGVTSIGARAFSSCYGLTSLSVESGNTTFDSRNNCNAIIHTATNTLVAGCKNTLIPEGVTSIGDNAFFNCSTLTSITIPEGVTSIGNHAFHLCTKLTSITIPASVTSIGGFAFDGCTGLTALSVESGSTTFDSRGNCNAIIETATNTLIAGCKNTLIPEGVTSIGEFAFANCTGLTTLTLPASVTSVGRNAFTGCCDLTTLTIPKSVTSIGSNAFAYCTGLTKIYARMATPPTISANVFQDVDKANCTLYVFEESVADYKAADVWKNFNNIVGIPNPNRYIYYTTSDGNIVTLLDTSVFGAGFNSNTYSDGQGVITFDGKVTSIGDNAFFNCSTLTSITIPEGVTSIGETAFYNCSTLTSITIPERVTSIGFAAFTDCTGLTTLIIPEGVTSIGDGAFWGCSGLTAISVESGNTTFDSRGNCNAIIHTATNTLVAGCKNTLIPEEVTSIGDYAFSSCTGLATLTIPASVTSIGMGAFIECTGLTEISIPESVTSINMFAFDGCSGLITLTIPESVTSIDEYAFQDCSGLTAIYATMTTPPAIVANVFQNVDKANCTLYVPEGRVEAYKAADNWKDFLNIVAYTPTFNEGYRLSFTPFAIPSAASSAQAATVSLAMETAERIQSVRFEVYWNPATPLYKKSSGAYQAAFDAAFYPSTDGSIHTVDAGYTNSVQITLTDNTGYSFATQYESLLRMTFYAPQATADGVYTITLRNIVFTNAQGKKFRCAPYSANVFLGHAPKAAATDGTVTFCGDYAKPSVFALLAHALPAGAFTTLDLTGVTALPAGSTFTLPNPNTLIRTAASLGLTQDNVVVGDACERLVLTDGHPFHNTKAFTAASASYSRTMTTTYGTIFLPFAPDTESYVFLTPTHVDATALTFDEVAAPQADTPYLFRKKSAGAGAVTATHVTIPVSTPQPTTSGNLTMKGTFTKLEFTATDNVYFILNDTFYRFASGEGHKLTINPFRAYFVSTSGGALYSIRERNGGTTRIDNRTMEETPTEIYDLQGRRITEPASGIYIVNGKKMYIK